MARNYNDDYENESLYGDEEEFEENEEYAGDDEYLDYEDEEAEADEYADEEDYADEYEDEAEDDDAYDAADYDESDYEDEPDTDYDDQAGYDEDEYDDGSENDFFARLRSKREKEEREEQEYYDEDEEAEEDEYEDANKPYEDDEDEEEAEGGKLTSIMERLIKVADNDYILYGLLIILPPIGLLLMYYSKKWDARKNTIWTVVAALCLLIWILLLLPGGSNDPTQDNNLPYNQFSAQPTKATSTNTPVPVPTENVVTPVPSATVHTVVTDENSPVDYVYVSNTGSFYHTDSTCGGMVNPSRVTVDVAQSRNLTPCPDCAGGNTGSADPGNTTITYYATSGGTYYHIEPNCSGMTGASTTTISAATAAGKKACPTCIGFYGTPGGTYYHSVSNCQGMTNAVTKTKTEWEKTGKTACPFCMGADNGIKGNSVPSSTMVFATTNGSYFHTNSTCSGMKNASQNTLTRAVQMGKKACATCVKPSTLYVFATSSGTYYHTDPNCSGMKGAQYVTAQTAIQYGKTPCQTCAKALNGVKGFGGSSTANNGTGTTTTATDTYVYCTTNGTYFHSEANCSGMKDAKKVTYANAITAKKKACPTCVKALGTAFSTAALEPVGTVQTASAASTVSTPVWSNFSQTASTSWVNTVFIDLSGADSYYHLTAKCGVMNFSDGYAVTGTYAVNNGYHACPVCSPNVDVTV